LRKSADVKDEPNVRGEEDVMIASTNGMMTKNAAVPVVDGRKGGDVSVARHCPVKSLCSLCPPYDRHNIDDWQQLQSRL
jgi:hypothetical protein